MFECTVIREDAKKAKTEETRVFWHIFIIGGISIRGGAGHLASLATLMGEQRSIYGLYKLKLNDCSTTVKVTNLIIMVQDSAMKQTAPWRGSPSVTSVVVEVVVVAVAVAVAVAVVEVYFKAIEV